MRKAPGALTSLALAVGKHAAAAARGWREMEICDLMACVGTVHRAEPWEKRLLSQAGLRYPLLGTGELRRWRR